MWRRSGIFIVNFEHISHHVIVFLLLTSNRLVEKQVTTLREDATEGRFHHSNTRANFLEFLKQLFF